MTTNPLKEEIVNLEKFNPSLKESMGNQFREYAIDELPKLNNPVATNIDYFDLHLFEEPFYEHKCYLIVNNYNNVNIKHGLYPIVIRSLELARFDKTVFEIPA